MYDAPIESLPSIKGGDKLYLRCTYDNSLGNPHVARALASKPARIRASRPSPAAEPPMDILPGPPHGEKTQ